MNAFFYRNLNSVDFDADQFMRDLESVMKHRGSEENGSDFDEEGSSSGLDYGNLSTPK